MAAACATFVEGPQGGQQHPEVASNGSACDREQGSTSMGVLQRGDCNWL